MKLITPLCCQRKAFETLAGDASKIETPEGLVHGAIAIAMHQSPQGEAAESMRTLRQMAEQVRGRVRGSQGQALVAHLHDYLFDELGFRGEEGDATDVVELSHLPQVLRTRRGLPIALSLVYVTVARWAGLNAWGVGLPGHFLSAVECDGARMLVDPFNGGRILSEQDAAEKMRAIFGPEAEFSSEMLEPVSHRIWLTRMMQNLLRAFGSAGQYQDVGAMLEMEMVLWPRQDHLQRDLALVLARLGMSKPAGEWLNNYLRNNPDDPQKVDLEQLLTALNP